MAVARGTVNMQSFGLASIYVAPSVDLEASKNISKKLLKLEAFFEWTPDEWTHCPWPLRVARRRPEEASRDDPNHLGMQKSDFAKMLVFPSGKQRFFEGRVTQNFPLFRSEAATASHQDGNKLTESLGNTPSALNEKTKKRVF